MSLLQCHENKHDGAFQWAGLRGASPGKLGRPSTGGLSIKLKQFRCFYIRLARPFTSSQQLGESLRNMGRICSKTTMNRHRHMMYCHHPARQPFRLAEVGQQGTPSMLLTSQTCRFAPRTCILKSRNNSSPFAILAASSLFYKLYHALEPVVQSHHSFSPSLAGGFAGNQVPVIHWQSTSQQPVGYTHKPIAHAQASIAMTVKSRFLRRSVSGVIHW